MFRALKDLEKGDKTIRRGTIFSPSELGTAVLERLIELGMVSAVAAPPLEILPKWKGRAKKLAKKGIETIEQFLATSDNEISAILSISNPEVQELKADALANLAAPDPGCGCGPEIKE